MTPHCEAISEVVLQREVGIALTTTDAVANTCVEPQTNLSF